jgi:hypothetical protein
VSDLIASRAVAALADSAAGSSEAAAHLAIVLSTRPEEYLGIHAGSAAEFLPTYVARQKHVHRTGIRTEGMDEFVTAIASQGQNTVYLVSVLGDDWNFVALLPADRNRLLACVAVEKGGFRADE